MSTTTSNPGPSHADKKDKKRKKTTTGVITEAEYDDLRAGFDLIIAFFHQYAMFHDLSDKFGKVIQHYGPIHSHEMDEKMKQFQSSQTQFLLLLKGREQTLKVMENICMERFGAALRNLYQVRRSHDLVLAIEAQQKYKIENLKKHSGYANRSSDQQQQDTAEVTFAVATRGEHEQHPHRFTLEQMKKGAKDRLDDREGRLAMESLALRGLRQLAKITTRNEEQVKNWKASYPTPQ